MFDQILSPDILGIYLVSRYYYDLSAVRIADGNYNFDTDLLPNSLLLFSYRKL